jgi:hypothetical protein
MFPLRTLPALAVLALVLGGARARDYDDGPAWTYRRGDGVRSFGELEYSGSEGYPAARLHFADLRSGDVKRFGVTENYSVYVVPATGAYVTVWHYREAGAGTAAGVYRVSFADGRSLGRAEVPGPGRGLAFLQQLPGLKSLDLAGVELTAADLACLRGLGRLESLRLAGALGTDGVPGAASRTLKSLKLPFCDLTDAGLVSLAGLDRLEVLDLTATNITAAGLERLPALRGLRELTLREVDVPAKAVDALAAKLPRDLRVVWTPGRSRAEREALAVLRKTNEIEATEDGTKPVTELVFLPRWVRRVRTDPDLGPAVMDAVMAFKDLDYLQIGGPQFTDSHLERLKGLPKLKFLWIARGSRITDAGLAHLKTFPALTRLDLDDAPRVTLAGLAHLEGIPKLEELWLQGRQFSDDAVPRLARLKGLKILVLNKTGCTDEGVERLRKALPGTTLDVCK